MRWNLRDGAHLRGGKQLMGESTSASDWDVEPPSDLGREAAERAAAQTVSVLRGQHSTLSGEDSGLGDVWLEFCVQVQGEQSIDWDDFELTVRQNIEAVLFSMTRDERKGIWLRTPAGSEEDDEGEVQIPADDGGLIESVYGKVWQLAADFQDERVERYLCPDRDPFDEDEDPADELEEEGNRARSAGERL